MLSLIDRIERCSSSNLLCVPTLALKRQILTFLLFFEPHIIVSTSIDILLSPSDFCNWWFDAFSCGMNSIKCLSNESFLADYKMSPGAVTQVVQGLSALAGAWVIKSILDAEQEKPMGGFNQCPTCNGSRRVPCLCTRWSDDDVGCSTCEGSGMMRCNACGGGGTGRPIPVQIRASNPPRNAWFRSYEILWHSMKGL